MADTYTTNLNLTKPEPGAAEDTWGISLNADLDSLDAIFGSGGTAVSMGAVTLDGLTVDGADVFFNSGWIKSNSSLRIDIDNDNNQTDRAFFISHGNASKDIFKASENGDISFYDDSGTSQNLKWDASADTLNFVDNAKATFGASNDLDISHSGTNSFIQHLGTGDLYIRNLSDDKSILLQSDNGSGGLATYVNINGYSGTVTLSHYGSQKLITNSTGIDVTGTATVDGLTSSGNLDIVSSYPRINLTDTGENPDYSIINANGIFNIYDVQNNSNRLSISSTGIDVTGTATMDGLTVTGTSYIQSTTQPQLEIAYNSGNITGFYRSGGDFQIKNDNGAGTPETSIVLAEDGAVTLYHDASSKLATTSTGIDVTGTLTSDGLTSNGDITVNTENAELQLVDTSSGNTTSILSNNFDTTISADGRMFFRAGGSNDNVIQIASGGDISFYDDTGSTQGLFWDASAESLGIGTTSPVSKLDVFSIGDVIATFSRDGSDGDAVQIFNGAAGTTKVLGLGGVSNNGIITNQYGNIQLAPSGTTRATISSTGIDVTGTVTSDGLTVDGEGRIEETGDAARLVVARTDNANAAESASMDLLESTATGGSFGTANNYGFRLDIDGSANTFNIKSGVQTSVTKRFQIGRDTGDISFYDDTGTTQGLFWDASAERLGIGTTSPSEKLTLRSTQFDTTHISIGDSVERLRIGYLHAGGLASSTSASQIGSDSSSDLSIAAPSNGASEIKFFTNTASGTPSEALRIDSSQNLLVGKTAASSYTAGFQAGQDGFTAITRASFQPLVVNRLTNDGTIIDIRKDSATVGSIGTRAGDLSIGTNDTGINFWDASNNIIPENPSTGAARDDAINLGASGVRFKDLHLSGTGYFGTSVGIGTTSPDSKLDVSHGSSGEIARFTSPNGTSSYITIGRDSSTTEGFTAGYNSSNGDCTLTAISATHPIIFKQSTSERMRIDSSGNLLVGKSSSSLGTAGHEIFHNGVQWLTASNSRPLLLNRLSTDGTIAEFRKDGTTVGNIGCPDGANGSQLVIAAGPNGTNTGVGLRFTSFTVTNIIPCYDDGSSADNLIDLGNSGARFDDIYATNGTIQTSDRNEKQDIQALTDAEQRVATACKGLIRRFRWQDAVEEKGDDARLHFGVIAQDLQDAFTAEGLDAGDYGMFISSTWEDDDGVEQTRLGVRYNELLAFIITTL